MSFAVSLHHGPSLLKFAERSGVYPEHPIGGRWAPVLAQRLSPMPAACYPKAGFQMHARREVQESDKNSDTERVQGGELD
jgi:hypothetical protein